MTDRPADQLTIAEARSIRDYMFLRRLRNEVRDRMTNETGPISRGAQIRFFLAMRRRSKSGPAVRIYVAWRGRKRLGYLLTKSVGDLVYISAAVDSRWRQQGIATRLVEFAKSLHPQLAAEIRQDNAASIAVVRSMGFFLERQHNGVAVYRFCRAR